MARRRGRATASSAAGVHQQLSIGDRGIGVQVVGDGNTVTIFAGVAELVLDQRHKLKAPARNQRDLLLTDLRSSELVGRATDLAALEAWLNSPRAISVRCLTGRAGAGKTRLGIELCERAEDAGWVTGFARHDELQRFFEARNLTAWRWSKPVLVVVDYAGAAGRILREWLSVLARRPERAEEARLRILLLERFAQEGAGWWDLVFGGSGLSGRGPDHLLDPSMSVALEPLNAVADRWTLLAQIMHEAAALSGLSPVPQPPPLGVDPEFDRRLAEDGLDHEPLFLMMAGIVSVSSNAPPALALSRIDLAAEIAGGEERRLERFAIQRGLDPRLITHLTACVTLQGGCTREAAEALVGEERAAMDFPSTTPAEQIANLLYTALPEPVGGGIDAVRPDLIGEAFLLRELGREGRPISRQAAIVERAFKRVPGIVVQAVLRTAQDYCEGAPDHASLLWLDHLTNQIDDVGTLIAVVEALPRQTVGLRERAAVLQAVVVAALQQVASDDPNSVRGLALGLNNLAFRLEDLDHHQNALAAAQQAVDLLRPLARKDPRKFRADLGVAVGTLSSCMSALGDRGGALKAAREAVYICRGLARRNPDAFRADLAESLNNFANRLGDMSDLRGAIVAHQEAITHHRILVSKQPREEFCQRLAASLNNLANELDSLGDTEGAIAAARESVELYRILAARQPDTYRPELAISLNTLALHWGDLEPAAALKPAQEAVDIRRELASRRPKLFRPNLAASLNNLSNLQRAVGNYGKALEAAEEAVRLRRALVAERPQTFASNLAIALMSLAACHDSLKSPEAAVAVNAEAIGALTEPFIELPQVFRNQMKTMVSAYMTRCAQLRQIPDFKLLAPALTVQAAER
jgi:tetratricopeptide (TPR) repeat protein